MSQYKVVPAPTNLYVKSSKDTSSALQVYEDYINSNCEGGWEYHSMEKLFVHVKGGCLGGSQKFAVNIMIFKQD